MKIEEKEIGGGRVWFTKSWTKGGDDGSEEVGR